MKLKTKPFEHQRKGTARAVKQGNHAFFFEPRCGKTKAALDASAVQHYRGHVRRIIVVAPLIALDVWVREVQTHLAVPARVMQLGEVPIHYYPSHDSSINDELKLHIILVNYDKFSRRGSDEVYRNRFLRVFEAWDPDLLILDESHRVKASGAVRSQALWRMVERRRKKRGDGRPWVYLLTGTPTPKNYIDIFSQYRIMDSSIFGTSRDVFEDRYAVFGHGKLRFKVVRYRKKNELLRKIRAHATIVTQKEAGLEGKVYFNPIRITLPQNARKLYNEVAEELMGWIDGEIIEAVNPAVRRLRLLQITGGYTTDGRCIHRAKVDAARDYLADLYEQGEHVVVYCRYIPETDVMAEICSKMGFKTALIRGGVKRRDRTRAIAEFQGKSLEPKALVFQADTGSLAIELTSAAESLFYSLPDSWETFYQCINRFGGPKQHRPVRHTFIACKGTADLPVWEGLRQKKDLHKEMMKRKGEFLYGF